MSRWKYLALAYLSRPKSDRTLYRLIRRQKVARIVELGVGDGQRAARMIALAGWSHPADQVRYAGVDLFEGRPAGAPPGITLKEAHRRLSPTKAKIYLAPGDPYSALSRLANSLPATDLVVISRDIDAESLAQAWFFVPRMLHAQSIVLKEAIDPKNGAAVFVEIPRATIDARASAAQRSRRAA